jgi:UDP-3-O-[3-hydroxymyristoyl] glucosamine N-acyltransferase
MQFTAEDIASILGAEIIGDPQVTVDRPSGIEHGEPGSITFLDTAKYEPYLYTTQASVVVIHQELVLKDSVSATLLRVANVREAFARLLAFYDQAVQARPQGISPQAYVDPTAQIGAGVAIGRFTTVERDVVIEEGAILFDQVYVGAGARIGAGSILYPGSQLLHQCQTGKHCVLHSNVVVGSEGFGFVPNETGSYQKVPQVGSVLLEDGVELGANSSVDRATMGQTIIRTGVKVDNLVQIGHNVEIGPHTVIAAQTGIAGSTKIGAHCRIGGQVGFVGHAVIADGTQIQAQSGIASSITEPNQAWFGSPAIPYRDYIRAYGVFKQLPALYRKLGRLERELQQLREKS